MSGFNEVELVKLLSKKSGLTIQECQLYCDTEEAYMKASDKGRFLPLMQAEKKAEEESAAQK